MESKNLVKKFILSFWFIAASAGYVFYIYLKNPAQLPVATELQNTAPLSTAEPATPRTSTEPRGLYADGSYTGTRNNAYYGMVQIKATIQNGKLTDVIFLEYPSSHGTSRFINSQAIPLLRQEAIVAQNANVNIISGATDTSIAFMESLDNALTQAKN